MYDEDSHPNDPERWLDAQESRSNWSMFGAKLWWMMTARQVLRFWPSKARIQEVLDKRKGVLHEELRIRVARQHLADDRLEEL